MPDDDRPGIMTHVAKKVQANKLSTTLVALATALSAGLAGLDAAGIKVIPWVKAEELKRVEDDALRRDEAIMKQLKDMSDDNRILMRSFWEQKRDEAEAELAINPNSRTAKALKIEAERQLTKLDQQDMRGTANP